MAGEWGPLEGLIGAWESDQGGLDAAFSHSKGEVLQTPYLDTINGDGSWSYDETTMLKMDEFPEPFTHTDRNILRKVG